MATISDVNLRAGRDRNHPNKEFFDLTFRVTFSDSDRRLGMAYHLDAAIYEIDEVQTDLFSPLHNESRVTLQHDPRHNENNSSDKDDFIGWLSGPSVLRPDSDGRTNVRMTLSKDVGNQERGNEEYRAFISLNPTTSPSHVFSPIVRINLG